MESSWKKPSGVRRLLGTQEQTICENRYTDTRHKNLITGLNKKHASSKLSSFKNSKENVEHLQNQKYIRNTIRK